MVDCSAQAFTLFSCLEYYGARPTYVHNKKSFWGSLLLLGIVMLYKIKGI